MAEIRASFDSSSSPNTILIEADDSEALAALQELLRDLSQGKPPRSVSIRRVPGVQLRGLQDLEFELVERAGRKRPMIHAVHSEVGWRIHWIGDKDDWDTRALMIEGLLRSPAPGHQYLNGYESLDPIEVEVSFREERH